MKKILEIKLKEQKNKPETNLLKRKFKKTQKIIILNKIPEMKVMKKKTILIIKKKKPFLDISGTDTLLLLVTTRVVKLLEEVLVDSQENHRSPLHLALVQPPA